MIPDDRQRTDATFGGVEVDADQGSPSSMPERARMSAGRRLCAADLDILTASHLENHTAYTPLPTTARTRATTRR